MTPFRSPPIDPPSIDSPPTEGPQTREQTIEGTVSLAGSFQPERTLREGDSPAPISVTGERISAAPISSAEA